MARLRFALIFSLLGLCSCGDDEDGNYLCGKDYGLEEICISNGTALSNYVESQPKPKFLTAE